MILAVGFGKQLMLIILALTMVGMLTGTSASKALASCGLSLLLGSGGVLVPTLIFGIPGPGSRAVLLGGLVLIGVQVMLVLIAKSVFLAFRFKPLREPLTADGPHAPADRARQMIFLDLMTAFVAHVIFEASRLTFLARVFPLSVALITLVLLLAAFALSLRNRPSYLPQDSEREWTADERPVHSELHFQVVRVAKRQQERFGRAITRGNHINVALPGAELVRE